MALPAGQRNRLDTIESALRASDPQLAAMFTIFNRLGRDEYMPRTEEVDTTLARTVLGWLRRPFGPAGWSRIRRRARIRAVLFFPAALAVMACGVWLGSSMSGAPRCAVLPRAAGVPQLVTSGKIKGRLLTGKAGPAGSKTRAAALVEAAGIGRAKASAACSAIGWPVYR